MTIGKRLFSFSSAAAALLLTAGLKPALAQTAPTLGTAQSFAILGASTVTNTGPSVVNGDLGVSPGTAVTGFPPGIVTGTIHAADAVAAQAQSDALTAYNALAGQACTADLTGQDLGGMTLVPGVYCFSSSAQLTGTLTLNGQGNPNAVFIFKIGTTLTTASNSSVLLINGASACGTFFQVGSSATLGTGTQFNGSIFAAASVTLNTNVNVTGRAVGLGGAVTMDSNVVSVPTCSGFVQVCKVAGGGVTVGTSFAFNIAGTSVSVAAGAPPLGTCSTAQVVPAGTAVITETITAGIALTGVSATPAGSLLSSNLGAGTATVTVSAGTTTIVTFIDTAPTGPGGFLVVCKVAGGGVTVGTNFGFSVAGNPVLVAAGAAPGGTCSAPIVLSAGPVNVTETVGTTELTAISTTPAGLLVSSNLAAGTATVTVNAGATTIVTFTNTIPLPAGLGFLQICKVAGGGVAAGANFVFNVAPAPISTTNPMTVAAGAAPGGTCGAAFVVTAGSSVITETIPAGTALTAVSTNIAGSLVSSNLAAGTATVTVASGGTTIVTFIDSAPLLGSVQICKVAGAGIPVGTSFTFDVGGTPVTAAAGPAPGGSCSAAVAAAAGPVVITEELPPGIVMTGVSASAGLLVSSNLAAATATVTVVAGAQTTVTFVDASLGAFQIRYAVNLNIGDSFIDITNTGASGGNLCANIYAFSPDEQLISCCSCVVTPNGLDAISAQNDLIKNPLTPAVPTAIVIKLLASAGPSCNPSTVGSTANPLVPGLAAWGTTLHALPGGSTFGTTETNFTPGALSAAELARMTTLCGFIQANGSGFGICGSCNAGGLGASRQ